MSAIRKGAIGPEVKGIQLRLNTRLEPSPKLNVDGQFGSKTEAAVIRFQRENGLAADGIVGPKTRAALAAPPQAAPSPHLTKFVAQLGTVEDFVRHLAALEATRTTPTALMNGLTDFSGTSGNKRYLLVGGDRVGVIDFRHFFAAASESYNSGLSNGALGVPLGGSPGHAVLLGLGNELSQCVAEALALQLNSCFAAEDLGSNRLGAGFGEFVKVQQAEATQQKVSHLLREYLTRYQPAAPEQISTIQTSGRWDVALEALIALLAGMGDILIPRAY